MRRRPESLGSRLPTRKASTENIRSLAIGRIVSHKELRKFPSAITAQLVNIIYTRPCSLKIKRVPPSTPLADYLAQPIPYNPPPPSPSTPLLLFSTCPLAPLKRLCQINASLNKSSTSFSVQSRVGRDCRNIIIS